MAYCLSLDEQCVALGFVGIGDGVASTPKKRSRVEPTTADTVQAEVLSTPSMKLPALPTPDDEEVKVGAEETKQQAEEAEVKLDDDNKEEVKLDDDDDGEEVPAKQADFSADDAELASTDRGLVMLAEGNEVEEEKKEAALKPVAPDDNVRQARAGEVTPAATETNAAQAGTSEVATAAPKKKMKKAKKAKATRVADNSHDSIMSTMCDVSFDEMAMALSYISLGGAAAPASSARGLPSLAPVKKDKKEKKAKKEEDDMDDLFDDDEEAAPKEQSRAEKMAAAKAAKDAKKKVDRSQIVFEVKPWDTETDLKELFKKICETKLEGLVWGEAHKLVPVAFGVKKLVLSCVVEDDKVGVEDITDIIEEFEDYVQSVDMTTMNRL